MREQLEAIWKQHKTPIIVVILACGVLALLGYPVRWALWPYAAPEWTGFGAYEIDGVHHREKKLWDWFELLIVPVVLAAGAVLFNWSQRRTDRRIAEERAEVDREIAENQQQDKLLQAYIDDMTHLLLEENLRKSKPEDETRTIARVRTLTVLRCLNAVRKSVLIRFLEEAGLITAVEGDSPIIALAGADLSKVDLRDVSLSRGDLRGANLSGADLIRAGLRHANLRRADLRGAGTGPRETSPASPPETSALSPGPGLPRFCQRQVRFPTSRPHLRMSSLLSVSGVLRLWPWMSLCAEPLASLKRESRGPPVQVIETNPATASPGPLGDCRTASTIAVGRRHGRGRGALPTFGKFTRLRDCPYAHLLGRTVLPLRVHDRQPGVAGLRGKRDSADSRPPFRPKPAPPPLTICATSCIIEQMSYYRRPPA